MLSIETTEQIKKLLGVDSIVIFTAKRENGGIKIEAGCGVNGNHAMGIAHAMALMLGDILRTEQNVKDITHDIKVENLAGGD